MIHPERHKPSREERQEQRAGELAGFHSSKTTATPTCYMEGIINSVNK